MSATTTTATTTTTTVDLIIGVNGHQQLSPIGQQWLNSSLLVLNRMLRSFKKLNQCKILYNVSHDQPHLLTDHATQYLTQQHYALNRIILTQYQPMSDNDSGNDSGDVDDENDRNAYLSQQFDHVVATAQEVTHMGHHWQRDIGNVRNGMSSAVQSLIADCSDNRRDMARVVLVDTIVGDIISDCSDTHSDNDTHHHHHYQMIQQVSEGVHLMNHVFYLNENEKSEKLSSETMVFEPLWFINKSSSSSSIAMCEQYWHRGIIFANNQNYARYLQELPANYCTPHLFCQMVQRDLLLLLEDDDVHHGNKSDHGDNGDNDAESKMKIMIRDREWAQSHEMNSFLSVSNGSDEPPFVLECTYRNKGKNKNKNNGDSSDSSDSCTSDNGGGGGDWDLVLVGKGVTFDCGGYSIKHRTGMKLMKSDQGGACTVVALFRSIVQLSLPINVAIVCMMTENMINGRATRPGDVVTASNGKTIEVDNTDAEGRLALADGLVYASNVYAPTYLIDMATLTGAIGVALSDAATGCFTSSNHLWHLLERASIESDDLFWRMPLFRSAYKRQLKALSADLNNIGGRDGGACTAATFLAEFVNFERVKHFAHLDIAEVVIPEATGECGTGRSTRTMITFVESLIPLL